MWHGLYKKISSLMPPVSLEWETGLLHISIAKRCRRFLLSQGIYSRILSVNQALEPQDDNHGIFDLSIPGEQFRGRVNAFRFVCRDNDYVVGENFIKDIHTATVRNQHIYTPILLTTFQPDNRILGICGFWGIPAIPASGLRDLAAALGRVKAGHAANYGGASELLRRVFMDKVDKRDEAQRLNDLAREDEKRGDWASAEIHLRGFIEVDPDRPWIYVDLANALKRQGKLDEAGKVLWKASGLFPSEPSVAAEAANFSQLEGNWPEAFRRWDEVMTRFPGSWIGVRGKIAALSQTGKSAEADALFAEKAPLFQHDGNALHDIARAAERRKDWQTAADSWRSFIDLNDKMPWAFVGLYRALLEQDRLLEAQNIINEARERYPSDAAIVRDAAQFFERLKDWSEAAKCWRSVARLQPQSSEGAIGESKSLCRQGHFKEADELLTAEINRLGSEAALMEAFGLNAMASEDWSEALSRFEAGQRVHPTEKRFATRIFQVRLRLADSDGDADGDAPAPRPTAASVLDLSAEDRALVTAFESLGGTGHGCEFGIFQRDFGAEPLGLLRWADLSQDQLSAALENEFAGVGEPEFTKVFVPRNSGRPEYWTTDTRYHMAMRCFVLEDDVPLERMTRQVTKRLKFLRAKLIDDLRQGDKIFVYKNMKRNLSDTELCRLHTACRRYGDNTLLYIQYQDSTHQSGTVFERDNGLIIGYIDRFSHTPDTDFFTGPATQELLKICRGAYALFRARTKRTDKDEALQVDTSTTATESIVLSAPALLAGIDAGSVVFLGNCQAGTLASLYREVIAPETGEQVAYVPSYVAAGADAEATVASASVLVRQVLDFAPATADLRSDGRTVLVPLVSAPFLWPCSGTRHPRNAPAPYLDEAGPYSAEIGDTFLNHHIARGTPAREAVAEYLAADIITQRRVEAMREMILTKQRSRDGACGGYHFAEFIERKICSEKLFRTANHPELPLTFVIAEEAFERVGVKSELISRLRDYRGQLFPKTEAPIHPAIARHFGLAYVNAGTKYVYFDEGGYTFIEYALRYMDYVWNADLPLGIHLSHLEDTQGAIETLQRAISSSPRSPAGHSVLSTLMAREGRLSDAVVLAQHAAELAPSDEHLARLSLHYQGLLRRR